MIIPVIDGATGGGQLRAPGLLAQGHFLQFLLPLAHLQMEKLAEQQYKRQNSQQHHDKNGSAPDGLIGTPGGFTFFLWIFYHGFSFSGPVP